MPFCRGLPGKCFGYHRRNLLTHRPIVSLDRRLALINVADQHRSSIAPEFVDTAFPQTATVFYNLKFELCKISDAYVVLHISLLR